MNRERIARFIEVLRNPTAVVPNLIGFSMNSWGGTDTLAHRPAAYPLVEDYQQCGTVCCAMGLAGLVPEFNDAGFSYDLKRGIFKIPGEDYADGFDGATQFFGLSEKLAIALFNATPHRFYRHVLKDDSIKTVTHHHVADALQLVLDGKVTEETLKPLGEFA